MDHSGVCDPSLASIFQVSLHAAPFVPCQKAVETDEEKGEENNEDNSNLGNFYKVTSDVVNDGQINIVAKGETVLIRNGKDG